MSNNLIKVALTQLEGIELGKIPISHQLQSEWWERIFVRVEYPGGGGIPSPSGLYISGDLRSNTWLHKDRIQTLDYITNLISLYGDFLEFSEKEKELIIDEVIRRIEHGNTNT